MNSIEELRDIKPLLEISDMSFYLYIGVLVFIGVIVLGIIFSVARRFWLNRKKDMKKIYFKQLKEIDLENPKESAYAITYLGRKLSIDDRSRDIFRELVPMLEQYKYRREVPKMDSETIKQYNLLVHVLYESI